MKEQEIGRLFKEKLAGYRKTPPESVWNDIRQDAALKKFNRKHLFHRTITRVILPIIGATVAVSTIALITFNNSQNTENQIVENEKTSQIQVVEKTEKSDHITKSTPLRIAPAPQTPSAIQKQTAESPSPGQTDPQKQQTLPTDIPATSNNIIRTHTPTPLPNTDIPDVTPSISSISTPPSAYTQQSNSTQNQLITHIPEHAEPSATLPKSGKSNILRFSKDTSVCRNSPVSLFVENAAKVHWSMGSSDRVITVYPERPIRIYAQILTTDNVDTTIYININVFDCDLFVPSAFTPNGDGLNDEFLVHAPMDITRFKLLIFDKMSRILFQTKEINYGWDGTLRGKPLPPGTYFYIITYLDASGEKHVMKGQLILIR